MKSNYYKGLRILYPPNGILWEVVGLTKEVINCKLIDNADSGYSPESVGRNYQFYINDFEVEGKFVFIHPFNKYLEQIEDDQNI